MPELEEFTIGIPPRDHTHRPIQCWFNFSGMEAELEFSKFDPEWDFPQMIREKALLQLMVEL